MELLLHAARERLHSGQQSVGLEVPTPMAGSAGKPVVKAASSLILRDALAGVYDALGFALIGDKAFRALVQGRIKFNCHRLRG